MMEQPSDDEKEDQKDERSLFGIIIHSFFIIPFLIAVSCLLLFTGIHLLTQEKRTAYDYLEDVKLGGLTKRWQAAFELSKILANSDLLPSDERFSNELISAFKHSRHDDDRVRQYLALAMGRTGRPEFITPLINGLTDEKDRNLAAIIYALGMLKAKEATSVLYSYVEHSEPRVRSITVVALGNIAAEESIPVIKRALGDSEANVRWGAALSLATMDDGSGKAILLNLMDRDYFMNFPEVDQREQNHLIIAAIEASARLNDSDLNNKIKQLSKSEKNMQVRATAMEHLNLDG